MGRLIDADGLYNAIKARYKYCTEYNNSNYDDGFKIALSLCMCDINAEPTVEAVVAKHGNWLTQHVANDGVAEELCSGCEQWSIGRNKRFCPNCGRWMDLVE